MRDWLSVKHVHRKALPVFLADAMDSAERGASYATTKDGKTRLPIAVIHQDHTDYRNSLVVMRLGTADEWFGLCGGSRPAEETS